MNCSTVGIKIVQVNAAEAVESDFLIRRVKDENEKQFGWA
ncbi:hypothetical protein J3R74_000465 [Puniceicoccus vermicola]